MDQVMDQETVQIEWAKDEEEAVAVSADASAAPRFGQTRERGRTYLTCAAEADYDDEEAMLAGNRPGEYLPFLKKCVDGQDRFFYDITGKQSLIRCYDKTPMTRGELILLFLSVKSALDRVEEYLLSEDGLVCSPAYVYRNLMGKQVYFVYLPAQGGSFGEHIRELARFLLEHVDYQDEAAVALAGQFYQYTEADNFSMTVFLEENRDHLEQAGFKNEEKEGERRTEGAAGESETVFEEERFLSETDVRPAEKTGARAGLAAAAAAFLAAWTLPQGAGVLIPAGICAGAAAGLLPRFRRWTERKLEQKEREVYQFPDGGA